jgi:hypothetical protein
MGLRFVSNAFGSIEDQNFDCVSAPRALLSVYTAKSCMRETKKIIRASASFDYNGRLSLSFPSFGVTLSWPSLAFSHMSVML